MDPFTQNGRSDVVILQSFYAIDSNTNLPITARYLLTTDGSGLCDRENSALELR